jgi:abhydrolase domain-containing protein 13
MGFRLPNIAAMMRRLKCNVFIVSYRGYGNSQGTPGEQGLMADADAAWEHVYNSDIVDKHNIFVFGRSLGGAVAIYCASAYSKHIRGLILENTFASISELVDSILPWVAPFKSLMLKIKWESFTRIPKVACPILMFSGQTDEVVPASHMTKLFELSTAARTKSIVRFPAGTHNDTWQSRGYFPPYSRFLQDPDCDIDAHLADDWANDTAEIVDQAALMQLAAALQAQQATTAGRQQLHDMKDNDTKASQTSASTPAPAPAPAPAPTPTST